MENLIDIMQLSTEEIDELVKTGCDIMEHPAKYAHKCDGKILATLFFEPSTRTRLSFESAMLSLFLRRQLLRLQGRERGGHHPGGQRLLRHHRHAPPQGGRASGGNAALLGAGDQRR